MSRIAGRLIAIALVAGLAACAADRHDRGVSAGHPPPPRARNVILFIGDGMGISTVTAARIFDGQARGVDGESNVLPFETFPSVALVKTYNSNQQVPDSAGTASAMNTGVKTRAGVLGIGPRAHRGDCGEALANALPTLGEMAVADGKAVGIVTTARLTHATPAAIYAHSADRDWESDRAIPAAERTKGCLDIAAQLMRFPFDVALGGGAAQFRGKAMKGNRLDDNADLIADWQRRTGGIVVAAAAELAKPAPGDAPILGLFNASTMAYALDRTPASTEPTLAEMTSVAIDRLKTRKGGYYLMVEGANIDHGHHEGRAGYALTEAQQFFRAIEMALSKVNLSDTLVLVTADHSHTFTIGGWPTRNNPMLGLVVENDARGDPEDHPAKATDGQTFTTLGYYNGPGAVKALPRKVPETGPLARQQALVPTGDVFNDRTHLSETHGGEDVPLYATGRGASAVRGVIEQNRIFDIILGALGLRASGGAR